VGALVGTTAGAFVGGTEVAGASAVAAGPQAASTRLITTMSENRNTDFFMIFFSFLKYRFYVGDDEHHQKKHERDPDRLFLDYGETSYVILLTSWKLLSINRSICCW
jgi:hypothetical protein